MTNLHDDIINMPNHWNILVGECGLKVVMEVCESECTIANTNTSAQYSYVIIIIYCVTRRVKHTAMH